MQRLVVVRLGSFRSDFHCLLLEHFVYGDGVTAGTAVIPLNIVCLNPVLQTPSIFQKLKPDCISRKKLSKMGIQNRDLFPRQTLPK